MAIYDLYSKRAKRARGETVDLYEYDEMPSSFKIQAVRLWERVANETGVTNFYVVVEALCDEYGLRSLNSEKASSDYSVYEVSNFFLRMRKVEICLDVIELNFRFLLSAWKSFDPHLKIAEEAINDLNVRFREHGLGYQFENGQIVRIDSQVVHAEIMKPALQFLSSNIYKGANDEFLSAHAHYRAGENKACLVDCLKAFESVMKAICIKRGWQFDPHKDTARNLIGIMLNQGLIPAYMESFQAALRNVLEGGLPTLRNKEAGHGQGDEIKVVPDSYVSYALHLTASNILFLVQAEKEMK